MIYLNLKSVFFRRINAEVNVREKSHFDIEASFSFSVDYSEDMKQCCARLAQEVHAKDAPECISIEAELFGMFDCEGLDTLEAQKQAHCRAYELLFGHMQKMIQSLSTNAGLSPIVIETARMSPEDITSEEACL